MKISYRNLKFVTHYQLNHPKEQMIDILQWPHIETGVIFAYILKVKGCDLEYIDIYKDQKAYSYFDSGFADTIFIYNLSSCRNKYFYILKFSILLQFQIKKMLWILVQKEPLEILMSWCSCMAGTSQSCSHVIAIL